MPSKDCPFVSRAGLKLAAALESFAFDVHDQTVIDLGCNVGGFVDCLLQAGAARVVAVDTGYGALDWKLRNDPRVVVRERTNALHFEPEELVPLVTVDVAWTRQHYILPAAARMLTGDGRIISLVKPPYEADKHERRGGILRHEYLDDVLQRTRQRVGELGLTILEEIPSPVRTGKDNAEFLWLVKPDKSCHPE